MCTSPHPLIVYWDSKSDKKGTIFLRCFPDEIIINDPLKYAKDYAFRKFSIPGTRIYRADLYTVPCGQCIQCRLAYSRQWANRCVCESLSYDNSLNWFVTLTYDPAKIDTILNDKGNLSLNFSDLQKFLKRLRFNFEYRFEVKGIRFYAAGEYGEQNMRPHFHLLLFNLDIPDKEIVCTNSFGDPLYSSEMIENIWGFGFVCLGQLNWNTAAYTARYCLKKVNGPAKSEYDLLGILPEACRMSLKPGIGADYLLGNFENIYRRLEDDDPIINSATGECFPDRYYDKIVLPSNGDKPNLVTPPRYFDTLYSRMDPNETNVDPERLERVKALRRTFAAIANENRHAQLMRSDREYFHDVDYRLKSSKKGQYRKFLDLC